MSGTSSQGNGSSSYNGYAGSGTYIVGPSTAGAVSTGGSTSTGGGTITESGDDRSTNAYGNNASLGSNGVWTVVSGSGSSSGSGFTRSSYLGAGVYGYSITGGAVAGTWNQNGGSNSSYVTQTNATENADGSWATTGTSSGNGGGTQNSSYVGAGTYTVGSSTASSLASTSGGQTVTGGGTTAEWGGASSTTGYLSQYALSNSGSWVEIGDTETSNSSGNSHSSNAGAGAYAIRYAGGATIGAWTQSAASDSFYSTQLVSTLVPNGILGILGSMVWATTGTSSGGGDDASNSS